MYSKTRFLLLACIAGCLLYFGTPVKDAYTQESQKTEKTMRTTPQQVTEKEEDQRGGGAPSERNSTTIYYVFAVVLIIWAGISLYLFLIDRKVMKLEKRMK